MSEVFFYHLTQSPLEATLRVLLEKSLGAGWRVLVRARTPGLLEQLDQQLWLRPEDSFLPHGIAGGPHDAHQPVLLTADPAPDPGRAALVSVEGAAVTAEEVPGLTRAMILFDGQDPGAVEAARAQWRSLTAAGLKAKYWSEETGRWAMKAESG